MILKHFVSEGMKNSPRNIYWWSQEEKERIEFEIDRSLIFFFFEKNILFKHLREVKKQKRNISKEASLNRARRNCERLTRIGRPTLRIIDSRRCTLNCVVENGRKIRRKKWKERKKKRKGLISRILLLFKTLSLISSIF